MGGCVMASALESYSRQRPAGSTWSDLLEACLERQSMLRLAVRLAMTHRPGTERMGPLWSRTRKGSTSVGLFALNALLCRSVRRAHQAAYGVPAEYLAANIPVKDSPTPPQAPAQRVRPLLRRRRGTLLGEVPSHLGFPDNSHLSREVHRTSERLRASVCSSRSNAGPYKPTEQSNH